jgi:hypothetical protein
MIVVRPVLDDAGPAGRWQWEVGDVRPSGIVVEEISCLVTCPEGWVLQEAKVDALKTCLEWIEARLKALRDLGGKGDLRDEWEHYSRESILAVPGVCIAVRRPTEGDNGWWLAARIKGPKSSDDRQRRAVIPFEKKVPHRLTFDEAQDEAFRGTLSWLERHRTLILSMLPSKDGGQGHVGLG